MTMPFKRTLAAALAVLFAACASAFAHPHVFVVIKSEIVYGPDGHVTAIRHAWTFDDMFSTYATQGLEAKEKGAFTREELAPLAEVNVTTLKEYDYFTQAKADGNKLAFEGASDYWLEYKDSILTLHFTLKLKEPVKAAAFDMEIYDPVYFIDFGLDDKDPVRLAGAPASCKLAVSKAGDVNMGQAKRLGEAFFSNSPDSSNYGAQFANKIVVKCQ
ncbi:MAG: DUF1007 family protein [Pseudorhodoplanes sp.]|nr:DUF1007 family protein [Pseudorhodoplanes sp.]